MRPDRTWPRRLTLAVFGVLAIAATACAIEEEDPGADLSGPPVDGWEVANDGGDDAGGHVSRREECFSDSPEAPTDCTWSMLYACDSDRSCGGTNPWVLDAAFVGDQVALWTTAGTVLMPLDGSRAGLGLEWHDSFTPRHSLTEVESTADGRLFALRGRVPPEYDLPQLVEIDPDNPTEPPRVIAELDSSQHLRVAGEAGVALVRLNEIISDSPFVRIDLENGETEPLDESELTNWTPDYRYGAESVLTEDGRLLVAFHPTLVFFDIESGETSEGAATPDGFDVRPIDTNAGVMAMTEPQGGGDRQYHWLGSGDRFEPMHAPFSSAPQAEHGHFHDGSYYTVATWFTGQYRRNALFRTSLLTPQ